MRDSDAEAPLALPMGRFKPALVEFPVELEALRPLANELLALDRDGFTQALDQLRLSLAHPLVIGPLQPAQLEALVSHLLPNLPFSVEPAVDLQPTVIPVVGGVLVPEGVAPVAPFAWRYLRLPVQWHYQSERCLATAFPLPVAVTQMRVDGYACLLSLTALWCLLPTKSPLHAVFSAGREIWPSFATWHVSTQHVFLPRASWSRATQSDRGHPLSANFGFSQYMGTALAAFGLLCYLLQARKCAAPVQEKVFEILGSLLSKLVGPVVLKFGGSQVVFTSVGSDIAAPGPILEAFLAAAGLLAQWSSAEAVRLGTLQSAVPIHHLVWIAFRKGSSQLRLYIVHSVAQALEKAMCERHETLHDSHGGVRLPPECASAQNPLSRVLKGGDKQAGLLSGLLSKSSGNFFKGIQVSLRDLGYLDAKGSAKFLVESFVAAYLSTAVTAVRHAITTSPSHCIGVALSFDASRVCKREAMVCHLQVGSLMVAAPLQFLADLDAVQDPRSALNVAAAAASRLKVRALPQARAKTKAYFIALLYVLHLLMPFGSACPWSASAPVVCPPGGMRLDGRLGPYVCDNRAGSTRWCVPAALRAPWTPGLAHVLSLVADEASTGWSLYQYLAGPSHFRIMWHPDAAHRFTNCYLNAMRAVPQAFRMVHSVLLVHKFKRAPFGGGKFWREAQSAAKILANHGPTLHPLLEQYLAAIAQDLGVSALDLAEDPSQITAAMTDNVGPRVEMRRWWTHYDASGPLVRTWHILLVALLFQELMEGRNPFARRRPSAASAEPANGVSSFAFKDAALSTLHNTGYLALLRSNLAIFRPLRTHFATFIRCSGDPQGCREFYACWADPRTWHQTLVAPALRHCLLDPAILLEIGLPSDIAPFAAPVSPHTGEASEHEELLLLHVRQTMEMVHQLVYFGLLYQSPPWCFFLLLEKKGAALLTFLGELRKTWELVLALESSTDPLQQALSKELHFHRWLCFREVFLLLEASGWQAVSDMCRSLVSAMFCGLPNTMACEAGFNDLRDHEQRGAKHMRRSQPFSAAVAIRSLELRKAESMETVRLSPEDIQHYARLHVPPAVFDCERRGPTTGFDGLDSDRIAKGDWPKTSSRHFSTHLCLRQRALLATSPPEWPRLWIAGVFHPHTLLQEMEPRPPLAPRWLYVVAVTPYMLVACRLSWVTDSSLGFPCDPLVDLVTLVPVVSWTAFKVRAYTLSLQGNIVLTPEGESISVMRHLLLNTVQFKPAALLSKCCQDLGLPVRKTAPMLELVEALLEAEGVEGPAAKAILSLVAELQVKRSRAQAPVEEGEPPEDDFFFDPEAAPNPAVMAVLQGLAPN